VLAVKLKYILLSFYNNNKQNIVPIVGLSLTARFLPNVQGATDGAEQGDYPQNGRNGDAFGDEDADYKDSSIHDLAKMLSEMEKVCSVCFVGNEIDSY